MICVPSPVKIEDIHLRLTGSQRLAWSDPKVTPTGLTSTKVDRTTTILTHQWAPFWGTPGKSAVLEKGNYEFPFEIMLPGDTSESVEGLREASITYKLKATATRGKLAYDLHAYKHVRVVRTLESSALEFLHAMSVENIWPNKVEYSIVVPQKAVVFGSEVPLKSRFSPLLKGLELGDITIRLVEVHDFVSMPAANASNYNLGMREFKNERVVANWTVSVSREDHWQEMIEDTGQEGWVVDTTLDLPRKLGKLVQDVNVHGIKVRHKLKMVVALKNPDGHISELRATLPLTIFISPNIPLDEQGNMTTVPAGQSSAANDSGNIAPPGYGEHVLDQLYDDVEIHNLQTPAPMSAVHSPMYGLSRAGSSENLSAMNPSIPVHPAALTSRLQAMTVSSREATLRRNRSSTVLTPPGSSSDMTTPFTHMHMPHSFLSRSAPQTEPNSGPQSTSQSTSHSASQSAAQSAVASRRNSGESHGSEEHAAGPTDNNHLEHMDDFEDMEELNKVPSYGTAMKSTRVGPSNNAQLPDYQTAASHPNISRTSSSASISGGAPMAQTSLGMGSEPLSLIAEAPQEMGAEVVNSGDEVPTHAPQRPASINRATSFQSDPATGPQAPRRRPLSSSVSFLHPRHNNNNPSSSSPSNGDSDERGWLHMLQSRGRVAT